MSTNRGTLSSALVKAGGATVKSNASTYAPNSTSGADSAGGASPLTKTQVQSIRDAEQHVVRNEKLDALSGQVALMSQVFKEAQRIREEQRRLQEERYQETLKKIQATRDYIETEMKRMNDTLKSFQMKFEHEISQLRTDMVVRMDGKFSEVADQLQVVDRRLVDLDQKIAKEREDRLQSLEETLGPIRKQISQLTTGLDVERKQRLEKEDATASLLKQNFDSCMRTVETQRFNTEQRLRRMHEEVHLEQERITKRQLGAEKDAEEKIRGVRFDLQRETTDRSGAQDHIVDNLTVFMKAFQENIKDG